MCLLHQVISRAPAMHPGHFSKKRRILREYGTKAISLTSSISKTKDNVLCTSTELNAMLLVWLICTSKRIGTRRNGMHVHRCCFSKIIWQCLPRLKLHRTNSQITRPSLDFRNPMWWASRLSGETFELIDSSSQNIKGLSGYVLWVSAPPFSLQHVSVQAPATDLSQVHPRVHNS